MNSKNDEYFKVIVDLIRRYLFKSIPAKLFSLGVILLVPASGFYELLIYLLEKDGNAETALPKAEIGVFGYIGIIFISISILIEIFNFRINKLKNKREEKKSLLMNYSKMEKAEILEKVDVLYGVTGFGCESLLKIFKADDNSKNLIEVFQFAHWHVLPKEEWFVLRFNKLKRVYFNWLFAPFVIFLLSYVFVCLIAAYFEYKNSNNIWSIDNAVTLYSFIAFIVFFGLIILARDAKRIGKAITFVDNMNPYK